MKLTPYGALVKHSETSTLFQHGKPSYLKFIESQPWQPFFARYCFNDLSEDPAFDLQVHIEKDIFFTEIMKTFVNKRRRTTCTDETQTVRQIIENYQSQKETIPMLQSNLFLYEGSKFRTCYLNNIHNNSGIVRHPTTSNQAFENSFETCLIFKYEIVDKLPYYRIIPEQDKDVNEVMSEIEDMGVEFVEALRCIADVLKAGSWKLHW